MYSPTQEHLATEQTFISHPLHISTNLYVKDLTMSKQNRKMATKYDKYIHL